MLERIRSLLRKLLPSSKEPMAKSQKDKLDKKLKDMEAKAASLEERATYAEKEAVLRTRIDKAEATIQTNRPKGRGIALIRIPKGGSRVVIVLVGIVVIVLVAVNTCG